jgi:hypothetical protein
MPMDSLFSSLEGDGVKYHTYNDIGKYTQYPVHLAKRMFPSVKFGTYDIEEKNSGVYAIMTREEGLRVTNDLSRLTLPSQRNVDYQTIARMPNKEVKEDVLREEVTYVAIYQDFCLDLLDLLKAKKPYSEYQRYRDLYAAPGVFDGVVNMLVQELRQSPIRPYLCCKKARVEIMDQVTEQIMELATDKNLKLHDFTDIPEHQRLMKIKLHQSMLDPSFRDPEKREAVDYKLYLTGYHKRCSYHWRPEDIRRVALG